MSHDTQRVGDTMEPAVRSNLDTIKEALRDAIMWQGSIYDAQWGSIPTWHRGESGRKAARAAIKQRNQYAKLLVSLSAPNAEAHGRRSRTVQPLVGASGSEGK